MKTRKIKIALTLFVIFVLMVLVVVYTTRLFYKISVANIYEVGQDKISSLNVGLENYLDTARSVLWVTADTVDNMVRNEDGSDRISVYLMEETTNQEQQFDENYTGLYGYVQGVYVDGLGWEPPEGYDPVTRDWYIAARNAAGQCTIVSPYVDAQTGNVIISISRSLSDGESVVSLDVTMNKIQEIISEVNIKGKGYGLIVNEDGMIVAHGDSSLNGQYVNSMEGTKELWRNLKKTNVGCFHANVNGEESTIFVDRVLGQWYVLIVVKDSELFKELWSQLVVNILIYLLSFTAISLICFFAYRNERKYTQRLEELKVNEQKQEYEAKVLRLEKKAADAANRAKGEFLAEMSHEIRTPINAVLGMNEMILRESREKDTLQYAANIQSAGKTLLSIINDILDFSKIEDGKMEILPVKYDLSSVIHNLVNAVEERAREKSLDFVVDIDENLPSRLYGDDVRVTQVIMNLLTNAVKYTEKGTITFSVHLAEKDENSVWLDVSVRDTGVGIREEDREKLFESFERLDEKKNRNIEGTGLGMSIVVKLLSLMGSEINLVSEYGKGSEFSFRLKQGIVSNVPMGNYARRVMESERSRKEAASLYAPDAAVLVVDDNGMNLEVVRNLMKRSGIVPELATSGMEAIEKIRQKHYDVIFLDHMMPKLDGIETLQKLHEERLLSEETYVIALTANAIVGARETYLAAGFDDYLSKPIDSDALEEKLLKYLPKEKVLQRSREEASVESDDILEFAPVEGKAEALEFPAEGNVQVREDGESKDLLAGLKELGILVDNGIRYCAGDKDFYFGILHDYVDDYEQKRGELERLYQEKNWKEYQVIVHALKTTSRTIGANDVSERARFLEMASGDGDAAYIDNEHGGFLVCYGELVENLKKILKKS